MSTNIFEQASRAKLRFETSRGQLNAEDLWDLPLTSATKVNLDDIAKSLYKVLKNSDAGLSFVTPPASSDKGDELRFELVKHVISVRIVERDIAQAAQAKSAHRQRLLALLDQKENEALGSKSIEEIRAELAAM